jgi:hypothetical protein
MMRKGDGKTFYSVDPITYWAWGGDIAAQFDERPGSYKEWTEE